jgi:hypothetical protein
MKHFLICVTIAMCCVTAHAETVHVLHVSTPAHRYQLSRGRARHVAVDAFRFLTSKGVSVKLGKFKSRPTMVTQSGLDNDTRMRELNAYGYILSHLGLRNPRSLAHVILPAIYIRGVPYLAGMAVGICRVGRISGWSVSNAERVNPLLQSRIVMSQTALAHEVTHLMGAYHVDDRCNLMHPDALACVRRKIPQVALETKWWVNRCLTKTSRRRVSRKYFLEHGVAF